MATNVVYLLTAQASVQDWDRQPVDQEQAEETEQAPKEGSKPPGIPLT